MLNTVIQAILHKSDQPLTGYDIAKLIKNKTGNSHQQIYRELNKIAQRNDVEVCDVPQDGKPDKKTYRFTGSGGFVAVVPYGSDFSKTKVGYGLLVRDILDGTNNFDDYMTDLKSAESKYLEMV